MSVAPDVASVFQTNALIALVPASTHGLVVVGETAATLIPYDDADALHALAAWTRRKETVTVFDDAKPALRALFAHGVVIRRPLCLKTLAAVLGDDSVDDAPRRRTDLEARDHGRDLLQSVEARLDELSSSGLKAVARLECLVLPAFAAMEARGLALNVPTWRALVDEAKQNAARAREETVQHLAHVVDRDLFGEVILNLDNDQDVKAALERAFSTKLDDVSRYTLGRIDNDCVRALLKYREANKIVTTYGDAFLERVDAKTGRVHATFIPMGASTGRVASRDPNLQNLPSDRRFHEALRAPDGRMLVTADYATCELRILADLAQDDVFLDAFAKGEDLHSVVATTMFNKPVSKTENSELRARAKAINFGLMYGMGAAGLALAIERPQHEAEALLDQYFKAFPRIRQFLDDLVEKGLKRGYAETVLGRRLDFDPEVLASSNARGELSRIARNMPIQGTSADMTKLAMVLVHERLQAFNDAGLVNSIHDELVVECDADEADDVARTVRDEMEAAHRTLLRRAPPLVEVHVAPHWAH